MGYFRRLDPEVLAYTAEAYENFERTDNYKDALSDYLFKCEQEFADSEAYYEAFEEWVDGLMEEAGL